MTEQKTTLQQLWACDEAGFVSFLGGIYEKSPWVAEQFFATKPSFDNLTEVTTYNALTPLRTRLPCPQLSLSTTHPYIRTCFYARLTPLPPPLRHIYVTLTCTGGRGYEGHCGRCE